MGFALGAVLMIAAGLVEAWLGVEAACRELEDIGATLAARGRESSPESDTGAQGFWSAYRP